MAFTITQLRNQILTSIHGRRLGIDKNEQIVGVRGVRMQLVDATSDTTGTALPNNGYVTVTTTTNDSWTLTDPVPGQAVTLLAATTSTGTHTIVTAAATIVTSGVANATSIAMTGGRASLTLVGQTTAIWLAAGSYGSVTISTV